MALISTLNNKNDDLIELNRDSFKNQSFNFNIPRENKKSFDNSLNNELFNRQKISDDVISMSSAGSSRASSPGGKQNYMKMITMMIAIVKRVVEAERVLKVILVLQVQKAVILQKAAKAAKVAKAEKAAKVAKVAKVAKAAKAVKVAKAEIVKGVIEDYQEEENIQMKERNI